MLRRDMLSCLSDKGLPPMNQPEIVEHGTLTPLTPEGHEALTAELNKLTLETRAEIAERIRESQQHGEFSEDNSELDQVKTEQAFVENRIAELRATLSHCYILDMDNISTDTVAIGTLVTLEDLEFGDQFDVRVVSTAEANPDKDFISAESPMGTAIYGQSKGETVSFVAPDGVKKFKIIAINR